MKASITRTAGGDFLEITLSSASLLIALWESGSAATSGDAESLRVRQALCSSINRWIEATSWRIKDPILRLYVLARKADSLLELIGLLETSTAEARALRPRRKR